MYKNQALSEGAPQQGRFCTKIKINEKGKKMGWRAKGEVFGREFLFLGSGLW